MAFKEGYINQRYNYRPREKVNNEEYNNGFNLLAEAINNSVEGVVENQKDILENKDAINNLVEFVVPDNSITENKIVQKSINSTHLQDDVFNKVSSLNYTQKTNANIARLLFQGGIESSLGYNNIVINKSPETLPLVFSGGVRDLVSSSLNITSTNAGSGWTSGSEIVQDTHGARISGASRPVGVTLKDATITANYTLKVDVIEPFNNLASISFPTYIIDDGFKSYTGTIARKDILSRGLQANDTGSSVTIYGVKDGIKKQLHNVTGVKSFGHTITITATPETPLNFTSYELNFILRISLTENNRSVNVNWEGFSWKFGWNQLTLNWTGEYSNYYLFINNNALGLVYADVVAHTAEILNKINTGLINFENPTKHLSVGYTSTLPLDITVYAESLTEPLELSTPLEVGGTYLYDINFPRTIDSVTIVFEKPGGSILPGEFTGYYIAG